MTARTKRWAVSALLYLAFFCWYTDLRSPLTGQEVDNFVAERLAAGNDSAQIDNIAGFFRDDTGRQFLMLNAIDYNENPTDVAGAEPGETAQQLMGRYMAHMLPALLSRASHPVVMGDAIYSVIDVVGIENAEQWDSGALFRYRSRRTLMDIISNPEFAGEHHFKHAALAKTIAYPIEPQIYFGDLRWILGLLMLAITALVDSFVITREKPSA
jgi:hypothetical protein